MMKINISQVKREIGRKESFSFVCSARDVGLLEEQGWLDATICVDGEVVNTGRLLEIAGIIRAKQVRFVCNRCLEEYSSSLEVPFSEEFQEMTLETNEEDNDFSCYQGDEIDITELVRESLLLAEPLKTLCREDCKGLCLHCGTNLNLTSCSCLERIVDPRLAVLQQFVKKTEP